MIRHILNFRHRGCHPRFPAAFVWLAALATAAIFTSQVEAAAAQCSGSWHSARLTTYSAYPKPGSEECIQYNGCSWSGQFYGLDGKRSERWVAEHNIAAVHKKDWPWLGMAKLRLRQPDRQIEVRVIDLCDDSDCDGCCTQNLGGEGYLIDLEENTARRFGADDGLVEFQVCR